MTEQLPDPESGYCPTLPPAQLDQIERWHERAYREGQAEGLVEQSYDHLGTTIVVPPEVMPITPMSHLLGEAVLAEAQAGERVLDMGTGSGVDAILAATRGAEVVAVDINLKASEAARANAARNGVASRVQAVTATSSTRCMESSTSSCSTRPFGGSALAACWRSPRRTRAIGP